MAVRHVTIMTVSHSFSPLLSSGLFAVRIPSVNGLCSYVRYIRAEYDVTGVRGAVDGPALGALLVIRLGSGATPEPVAGRRRPRGIAGRKRTTSDDFAQRKAVAPARHEGARPHQEEL